MSLQHLAPEGFLTMDYNKNIKYLKSNDRLFYTGVVVMGVGVVLIALTLLFHIWFMPMQSTISLLLIAAGAGIAFIPRSMRSNSSDLDSAVAQMTDKFAETTAERTGLNGLLIKNIQPFETGAYTFDDIGFARRAKGDRKVRTSVYTASAMLFTKTGIYIAQKKISLIEDKITESNTEFLYEDIDKIFTWSDDIALADGSKSKLSYIIINENGKEAIRIPTANGSAADKLCNDVMHMIKLSKNS